MKWIWLVYPSGYSPSGCHPLYAKKRIADVQKRHGVVPERVERVENVHVDYGGCMDTRWEPVVIPLAKDRRITIFEHHMPILEDKLLGREPKDGYVRFGSWPGKLVFISGADRRKVLAFIKKWKEKNREDVER